MAKMLELRTCLQSLLSSSKVYSADEEIRTELLDLVRKASVQLENPFETFQRITFSPLYLIIPYVAQQHGIVQALEDAAGEPVSVATLVERTHCKPDDVEGILRYLCSQHIAQSAGPDAYTRTPQTARFLSPLFMDGFQHYHDAVRPALFGIAGSLEPPFETAFNIGHASPLNIFEWFAAHPDLLGAFQRFMGHQFASLPTWLSIVDFTSDIAPNSTSDSVLLVDVGGSLGHQSAALRSAYPKLPGRIVLQDRPEVLAQALPDVEKMEYDYRTTQPLKEACAYYFRQTLHDNSDDVCIDILRNQLPAMGPSSVVIIDEKVLPDTQPSEYLAGLNWIMRACCDSKERSERQWKDLLDRAGFAVKEIKPFTRYGDAVIIAVPKNA